MIFDTDGVTSLLRKNGLGIEFFLCLSRACLGKNIVFKCKRLKKTVFLGVTPLALSTAAMHGPAVIPGSFAQNRTSFTLVQALNQQQHKQQR